MSIGDILSSGAYRRSWRKLRVYRDEGAMLYEFVTTYRDAIVTRAREKLTARPWPAASAQELENGVPVVRQNRVGRTP